MSCSTSKNSNTPYIKIGDSFNVPIQLINTTTGEAVEILNTMTFTSNIVNLTGDVIASPIITPYVDQVLNKGYVLATVDSSITSTWLSGKVKMDIKMEFQGNIQHSQDFSFYIIEAITS